MTHTHATILLFPQAFCPLKVVAWNLRSGLAFFPVHKNQPNQKPLLKYIWDLGNPGCTRCLLKGKNKNNKNKINL